MSIPKFACVLLPALLLCVSCTAPGRMDPRIVANDRLSAEYSQAKKRIPLLERENDVLKEENLDYRRNVRRLGVGLEELSAGLDSLRNQVEESRRISEADTCALQERLDWQEEASAEQIEALTASHQEDLEKLQADIRALNERLAGAAADFKLRIENISQKNTENQHALLKRIGELQRDLAAREAENETLKSAVADLSARLDAALREIAEISRSRTELQQELEAIKATEAELLKRLNELLEEFDKQNTARKQVPLDSKPQTD